MVLSQPRVTGFLSLVGVLQGLQANPCPPGKITLPPWMTHRQPTWMDQAWPVQPYQHACNANLRKSNQWEKAKQKGSKNLSRAKSGSTDNVVDISARTPTNSNLSTVMNDNEISLLDLSLREILASGDESPHGDNTDDTCNHHQHIIKIESELVATRIALEGEKSEVARLKVLVELLEREYTLQICQLDGMKKTLVNTSLKFRG